MSTVYMTEEEQIEALKAWWKRYQRIVIIAVSVILLAVSGWKYWHWHQQKMTEQASTAYEHLMTAFSNQDTKAVRSYAQQLTSHYPGTVYADTAYLMQAKLDIAAGQDAQARQSLSQVAAHSKFAILSDVARLRLARVLAYEKSYEEALKTLDNVRSPNFDVSRSELRGDIYHAMGKYQEALDAYQMAKENAQQSGIGHPFLEMKQQDLLAVIQSSTGVRNAHALS